MGEYPLLRVPLPCWFFTIKSICIKSSNRRDVILPHTMMHKHVPYSRKQLIIYYSRLLGSGRCGFERTRSQSSWISKEAAHTVNIIHKLPCSGDHNWGRVGSKQQTGCSSGDHDPQLAKAWSWSSKLSTLVGTITPSLVKIGVEVASWVLRFLNENNEPLNSDLHWNWWSGQTGYSRLQMNIMGHYTQICMEIVGLHSLVPSCLLCLLCSCMSFPWEICMSALWN